MTAYEVRLESEKIKRTYFETHQRKCASCGSTEGIELHHIVPVHQGGTNDFGNLVALCHKCHRAVHGDKHRDEYNTPDAVEIKQRKASGKTQGVIGAKMDRINLALRPGDNAYIKTMCHYAGYESYSDLVHDALELHKAANIERYKDALAFIKKYEGVV